MRLILQEYALYCFDTINLNKTFNSFIAISPEDAYKQAETKGLEPISWVCEDGCGDY